MSRTWTRRASAAAAVAAVLAGGGCATSTATEGVPPTDVPAATRVALPPGLTGHVITVIPTARRLVALTFDCGSGGQGMRSIRHTLTDAGIRATFFVTGRYAEAHPRQLAGLVAAGHVVGNHTMAHPHLNTLDGPSVRREVRDGAAAVEARTGRATRPWFRFPFGEYTPRTLRIVNDMGFAAIGWTVDSRGWLGTSSGTRRDLVRRVMAALRPGAIVLMHVGANPDDGTTYDADALPRLIERMRAAGYGFTTVRRLLRTP
jgi:peptidoglycan/xylan/chitin deacetylase (PgdA/CDA1 family)